MKNDMLSTNGDSELGSLYIIVDPALTGLKFCLLLLLFRLQFYFCCKVALMGWYIYFMMLSRCVRNLSIERLHRAFY